MYDYAIIGSGPSGGLLAHHLHNSGANCVLIEAGKLYRKNTFPENEADYSAQLYWGGGMEFDQQAKMVFLRSKAVGGTSIVNQCLMDRFDDIAFNDWNKKSNIDFFTPEKMAPYYEKVENHVQPHTFSEKELNTNAKKFLQGCDAMGYRWDYLHRGQTDCCLEKGNDCIGCLGGCYRDSKQSSLVSYIQPAEKKGLKIISEFNVETIEHNVEHVVINGTINGTKNQVTAKKIILACGSLGTTQILLRSGFKKKLPALGKNFSCHPQFMTFGIYDQPIDAHKGAFQTVASKDPSFRTRGFKLENVFAPPISVAMLFDVFGKEHQQLMKKYRYLSCIEVAVRDEETGEITIDKKGKLIVKKELTERDKKRRDDGLQVVKNIMEKSGAKQVFQSGFYFGLHLMGGCSIGTNPEKSVVDPEFKVHGFKNIFIADSSIFPMAPGINPSLTIMALSEKLSEQLLKK